LINLPARFRATWAKPSIAGLLALSLSASAGMVVAAQATVSQPAVAASPAAVAAPNVIATSDVVSQTITAVTRVVPRATVTPAPRAQLAAQAKTVAIAPRTPAAPTARTTTSPAHKQVTVSYHGVYHLWIPGLSLSRDIYDWGCNGGLIPNRVEYWGCAGHNNLYLLGHAWGVFAKIHDSYHSGALRVGLTAFYADTAGVVHRYRISWVRHVANADYASWSQWAMAASSGPVITLQTCDGATSAYRILVRLVPA
jgi:hypothetical protein